MDIRGFLKNPLHLKEKFSPVSRSLRSGITTVFQYCLGTRGLVVLFLLSLLIGAAIKTSVNHTLTIGFQDYLLMPPEKLVDLNTVQKEVLRSGGSLSLSKSSVSRGQVCSQ